GEALLSWRVLLLPYLGYGELHKQFRLDESWDSPHNLPLLKRMPAVYRPVRPDESEPFTTRLQVLIGPGTPFEVPEGPRLVDDFPDGTWNTILVSEARRAVPWTEPAEMAYSPNRPLPSFGLDPDGFGWRIYSRPITHEFHCCMADGSVHVVSTRVSESTLRRAITRNDGL